MSLFLAEKIIDLNSSLNFDEKLPKGFRVLNPFKENPESLSVMAQFYRKFYNDNKKRRFIIGINPSRHGAGVTGVPFTDTKRLETFCNIKMHSASTHEISSVFMYDMIAEYGGPKSFYSDFYINSPFPLAIVQQNKNGKWVNVNYYDYNFLFENLKKFMINSLKKSIELGLFTSEVYVLGKKNAVFIDKLNSEAQLFNKLIILEHPRYIQQYKSKERQFYIDKYILTLNDIDV